MIFFVIEINITFFFELISKITIFFLRSVVFNRSEINEYSELEICFFSLEILNFSSTKKTILELLFLFLKY